MVIGTEFVQASKLLQADVNTQQVIKNMQGSQHS